MPGFYIDSYYIILVLPCLLFGLWASFKVNSTFKKYSQVRNMRGYTGADAAKLILSRNGISDVAVNQISGNLTDNYDPKQHAIHLSQSVYGSTSVAAIGVAAHEAGHAVQHATNYFPIKVREVIVPVTQIGSYLYLPLIILGAIFSYEPLVTLGIMLFATIALFQLVTLPVEFNASRRALAILEENEILYGDELKGAKSVLTAAALTYVAALMTSLAQLLRLILVFGGRNRRN